MGIQQIQVTVTGNLGADPKSFGKSIDAPACSFRVGVTPRYFDGNLRRWRDRETTWVGVRAYRTLASNVLNSLHKGDPVIVTGTLQTERWRKPGDPFDRITPVIDASAIGHDLSQGIGRFRRVGREQPAANGQVDGANGSVPDSGGVVAGAGADGAQGGPGAGVYGSTPSNDPMAGARTGGTNIPGLSVPSTVPSTPVELNVGEPEDGDGTASAGGDPTDYPTDGVVDGSVDGVTVDGAAGGVTGGSVDGVTAGGPADGPADGVTADSAVGEEHGQSAF